MQLLYRIFLDNFIFWELQIIGISLAQSFIIMTNGSYEYRILTPTELRNPSSNTLYDKNNVYIKIFHDIKTQNGTTTKSYNK